MFLCEPVKALLAKVIETLKNAGLLRLGDSIEMFLFSEYSFDSLENWVLITMFIRYLKMKVNHFSNISPRLKLGSYLLSSALLSHNNDVLHDV